MPSKETSIDNAFLVGNKESLRSGEIPSVAVYGRTLPEVWEKSVLATWEWGCNIPTQYDQEIDPESKDTTIIMVVSKPLEEPRIHRALPGGYADLEIYRQEVVEGIHDHWVSDDRWSYSYHDRMVNWPGRGSWEKLDGLNMELQTVDQMDKVVNQLAVSPETRRAQATTWVPWIDSEHHEPPCLQRVWCRVVRSDNDLHLLEMNTHWRSRDAFKAAFMNMYALTDLQGKMAEQISETSGRNVQPGRYVDISDSYHIYGSYIRKGEMERFFHILDKREFEDRIIKSDEPKVVQQFEIARAAINEELHTL